MTTTIDFFFTHVELQCANLTVYATEVEEVSSTVHLVELEAHLSLHASDGILPSDAQIIWIHNLQLGKTTVKMHLCCPTTLILF